MRLNIIQCRIAEPNLQITNPYDIANTFNIYFGSIAETTKKA